MPAAILIDGAFFLRRYRNIYPLSDNEPKKVAKNLYNICLQHLSRKNGSKKLYRIFFYDCLPITKKAHHPLTKRAIDFSKTKEAIFRHEFHKELRKCRKVALRLGRLSDHMQWIFSPETTKKLVNKEITIDDVLEDKIKLNIAQKGVDMKIGLDIASLAYKKLVDQIILIAGDSDFVPAAKLARREGIDFILDPMWNPINPDLHEHIDGLYSTCIKPNKKSC